jgi:hypothetical protein
MQKFELLVAYVGTHAGRPHALQVLRQLGTDCLSDLGSSMSQIQPTLQGDLDITWSRVHDREPCRLYQPLQFIGG